MRRISGTFSKSSTKCILTSIRKEKPQSSREQKSLKKKMGLKLLLPVVTTAYILLLFVPTVSAADCFNSVGTQSNAGTSCVCGSATCTLGMYCVATSNTCLNLATFTSIILIQVRVQSQALERFHGQISLWRQRFVQLIMMAQE